MRIRVRAGAVGTALLVLLVVASTAASAAVPAEGPFADHESDTETDTDTADEIYVTEGGDAVLVYEEDSTEQSSGHIALNVSQGLLHMLVRSDAENTETTGNARVVVTPDSLDGNGSFTAERPEDLSNLDFNLTATRTASDSSMHASLNATTQSDDAGSTSDEVESAAFDGAVVVTADEFSTNGSVTVEYSEDQEEIEHRNFTLEETESGYTLDASEEYEVSRFERPDWDTRENATETLEADYNATSSELDGNATVTLESYEFRNVSATESVVDIEYTVVYTGIDEELSREVATSITDAEDIDVSDDTAEAVGDGVANVEVERVNVTVNAEGTDGSATWDVQLSNYSDLAHAGLDLAEETSEDENITEQIRDARERYEAMETSGLEQSYTWSGSVSSSTDDEATISATFDYRTDNYDAYVSELRDRDVYTEGNFTFRMDARTEDDEVVTDMSMTVERQDLVEQATDTLLASAEATDAEDDSTEFLEAFQRANFEKARMDVRLTDEEVTFEGGANFRNMSAFQSALKDEYEGEIAGGYVDYLEDDDESVRYVYVRDAFEANASEETVRDHESVGDDTDVFLPADWDPADKEFPKLNGTEARTYLGLELPSQTTPTTTATATGGTATATTAGGPGFTVAAALVALVVAALALRRE